VSVGNPSGYCDGLLDDVSLDSARNLAQTTYARIEDTFGLNDHANSNRASMHYAVAPELIIISVAPMEAPLKQS
jgi:hypothetical protein